MAQPVDESDLIPDSEADLEEPSETAAARREAIASTPLPETQRPPIFNPKSRAALRTTAGIALPTAGAGIAGTPGAVLGSLTADALDKSLSPPEEDPSLLGMGARAAAEAIVPYAAGKVAKRLAPLTKQLPKLIPKSVMESEAISTVRNVIHKAQLFKSTSTEEKKLLDGIVQEATNYSPLFDAKDLLEALNRRKPIFGKDEFADLMEKFTDAAKASNGNFSLPELHVIMRTARDQAKTRMTAQAVELVKKDVLDAMEKHIAQVHPLGAQAGKLFRNLNNEIGTKLGIAEDAISAVQGSNPLRVVTNIVSDPEKLNIIKALDHVAGGNLAGRLSSLSRQIASEGTKAGEAATLKAAQEEARGLLKGLLTAASITTGSMSNVLLSLLTSRMGGALPLERVAALGAKGIAAAAPALTAAVGKGVQETFRKPKSAVPEPVSPLAAVPEGDLEPEEEP